jgi:hypothetical protein
MRSIIATTFKDINRHTGVMVIIDVNSDGINEVTEAVKKSVVSEALGQLVTFGAEHFAIR